MARTHANALATEVARQTAWHRNQYSIKVFVGEKDTSLIKDFMLIFTALFGFEALPR